MDTLFDVNKIEDNKHKCNQCKYFYRKYHERGHRSWGKCELGKSSYDAPALKSACPAFIPKEEKGGYRTTKTTT